MMPWQAIHMNLLDDLNKVAGKQVRDFEPDTAHLRGRALREAKFLNAVNTWVVDQYYEEQRRRNAKERGR